MARMRDHRTRSAVAAETSPWPRGLSGFALDPRVQLDSQVATNPHRSRCRGREHELALLLGRWGDVLIRGVVQPGPLLGVGSDRLAEERARSLRIALLLHQ
jgi:hypothetical protein